MTTGVIVCTRGDPQCYREGCVTTPTLQCDYRIDHWGNTCATWMCEAHRSVRRLGSGPLHGPSAPQRTDEDEAVTDTLAAALYSIPADDREMWVQMCMAIKSELGEAGFDLWDGWSRQSERHKAADARAVWRSIKPNGGITIGSLYHEAKANGWQGDVPARPQPSLEERRRRAEQAAREAAAAERRQQGAATRAENMVGRATFETHPYLVAKGFSEVPGLVLDGALVVPMRDAKTGALCSLQEIQPDGSKNFLPGGRAKGAVRRLGRSVTHWYCEGYATGLSIQAALRHLYRRDELVVCFSAHNMSEVAHGGGYVVADHDENVVGQAAAFKTSLPYWMPPEPGSDANDYHRQHGIEALAEELRGVLSVEA